MRARKDEHASYVGAPFSSSQVYSMRSIEEITARVGTYETVSFARGAFTDVRFNSGCRIRLTQTINWEDEVWTLTSHCCVACTTCALYDCPFVSRIYEFDVFYDFLTDHLAFKHFIVSTLYDSYFPSDACTSVYDRILRSFNPLTYNYEHSP